MSLRSIHADSAFVLITGTVLQCRACSLASRAHIHKDTDIDADSDARTYTHKIGRPLFALSVARHKTQTNARATRTRMRGPGP